SMILLVLMFASCSQKQSSSDTLKNDSLSVPADINIVVGIGKVEPEAGIVNLASDAGGIVQTVRHTTGDTVKKGEVILVLQSEDASLKVQQLRDQITTQEQQVQADQIAVRQYQAQLQNKM